MYRFAFLIDGLQIYFSVEIFPHLRMGKEDNSDLTEKSVAKAKLPSNFPIFPKFDFSSENSRNSEICGLPQISRLEFSRKSNFGKSHKLYSISELPLRYFRCTT